MFAGGRALGLCTFVLGMSKISQDGRRLMHGPFSTIMTTATVHEDCASRSMKTPLL